MRLNGYRIIPADDVGFLPRQWALDEGAARRIIESNLVGHPYGLHGFSRHMTADEDCTVAIVIDLCPFEVVRSSEVRGRRASHWCSFDAAYRCALDSLPQRMLIRTDEACPATPWAVVDTRSEARR